MRVRDSPTASARIARRGPAGNAPAADAKAPMCSAWPEGKASLRLPENGTPRICPMTVRRSGRVWSNRSFKPWGSSDAATVTSRAWLPAHRSGSPRPREASQPTAARTRRTFSSAPHVSARATSSGAGAVLRAIDRATATSALVGWTVTGKLGPRLRRLADNLAVLNMTQRIGKESYLSNAPPADKGPPFCRNPGLPKERGSSWLVEGKHYQSPRPTGH